MRWFLLFLLLSTISTAYAQQRYAFGPKKGEVIPTEENKRAQYEEQSLLQLQRIEEQLKASQEATKQQMQLLQQQNQLLTTLIQLQQQQQLQQQAPIAAPTMPPLQ